MSNQSMFRRIVLSATVFLALLAALPAQAAKLVPDKTAIAVGETIYIRLEADLVIGIDWSAGPELQILSSDSKGATVKGVSAGTATVTAKWLGGKKSTKIAVGDVAASKDQPEDDREAVRMEGLARAMGMPDLDARIARMLFEVNTGKRTPKQFYDGLAKAGGNMFDVIKVRSRLVDHPDQSFTRQVMGPTYSENGTPVEQKILTWRRTETLAAIDEVVKRFVDSGRVPADGYALLISHVGKWANQADRSLTFTGDIDFSFVSNDTALAEAMKEAYAEVIKRRTGLDPKALDSVCTAHGKAGLEVYIGRHGMAFAEQEMKINELVDMSTGARTKQDLKEVAHQLTSERDLADAQGKELAKPVQNTEPGLSMEMARHFEHDIVGPKLFDLGNAVVKAAKYLGRSYKALNDSGGSPGDAGLAEFARRITELANAKPQTRATRDETLRLISERLGSPPATVWDMGTNKLVLTIDQAAVERFHSEASRALWDNVRQGSTIRTNALDQRLRDLLERQNKGDKVDEDVAKLRQEMVDLVDMVEAEVKAAHGADIPIEVHTNNAKVRAMLDTLSRRFGVKNLSPDELKDKKFVEELLKAEMAHPDPSRLKMIAGYVMERTARAAELSMAGVEKTNQLLDFIDNRYMGPLRGDADFAEFETEMRQVQQAARDPRLRSESTTRLGVVKTKVASAIKGTNLYLNEKLQATAAGRQGMKLMMVYGLVDEMQAYRDAFNEQGWGGFATEVFKRRIPFGSAVESAVMGNTLRAGWDVVTTLIPPLALPEAAYGLGTMIGTQVKSTYWNEQLALFTDGLYADAIFKLEAVETYENAKIGQYRLVRTFHNQMPLDLHRFAEMRKDQVEALSKEVEAGHVNWQAYKNNFNGFTEWLDVDATLKANLAASDPALMLLEEMASHPAVGQKLMDRLAEKGLARWEQVKLGYVVKLIKHLEDRKQADDALARGQLPDLFAELRKVAADLAIENEVMKGLDAEVDTSNLKNLVKWLWDVKRSALDQAPTESETTRAAQVVKKYLDTYKQVQALRDQAAGQLAKAAVDVNTRYLTSNLFLSGRAEPDLAAARAWVGQIESARKAMAAALLAIKKTFLPKAGLDSADQPYLDRAFAHEVWIKPYQDGNARLKKAWMKDYADGHVKERDKVLAEYKDWLTKLGPVQLTVTATDAKDGKKAVTGLKIALTPTDELGKAVSASAGGNQVVMAVAMGRYSLSASAPGYQEATRSVVYGRGLTPTPSEAIALTPTGKEPDKDKDKDKDGKPDDGSQGTGQDGAAGVGPDGKAKPARQGAGGSASGQYPGEPFNGMQISYSFSGCSLPEMTDKPGFTTSRTYKGRLGSGSMTVSGSARMGAGYGATLSVSVNAGGEHKEYTTYIKTGWPGYNTANFNLTIPIPATATGGGFGIRMDGEYNAGGRGLVVSGYCTADGPEGDAPKGTGELSVDLTGPNNPVPLGQEAEVSANAKGGRFPYSYAWTGASGSSERVKVKITRPGSQPVAVTVNDSEGKRAGANLTIKVAPLKLELAGLPNQAYYGSRSRLQVNGLPDFQPAPDPCAGRSYTGSNPFDECLRIRNVPTVSVAPRGDVSAPEITAADVRASTTARPVNPEAKEGAYRFIWQSEPGLTFEPPTSTDGATWVTFDRMGQVKVWCEVHQMIEGAWQTIGETDQKTVNVVAPAFTLNFDPADGQGKVGQDVRVRVVAKPEVPAKLIDYRWFEPASSNRMEYTDNASEIGFKVKDTKAMKLEALARVPHYGDEIAKIAGTYTGVAYDVKISPPKARGPQLQVWVCDTQLGNARNCGMKDIPQGQFVTFQDIFLAAQVTPAPQDPRYRWTVDPSGSCGLPGSGSELRLNCSNTGSYTVRLAVTDKDNILLGQAETAVSVSVNDNDVKQAPKSKEAYEKLQQAKQQASDGQLDPAIDLANSAAGLDPKNTEARDLAKRWSDERNTVRQQLDQAKKALQAKKPADAQKAVDAAKKLHPKYPPVREVEQQIADQQKGQGVAGKPPVETPPAVGAVQPISLASVGGNKGTPRTVKGVSIDDSSWIRLKSTDENRRSLDIPVPTPTRAAAVAIVSNLDDATYLEQGKTIARIIVSKDTGDEVLEIQAGVHSSEWNYGVGPKHKRVDSADIGDNRFLVVLPLARPGLVKGIRVEYVETGAAKWSGHAPGFCLRGVSLVADTRGLVLTPAGSSGTSAGPAGNAAGKWKTSEGEMTLNQAGRSVTGSYASDGGEIVGEMNGNVLEGYWIENGANERCATPRNGRHYWGRIVWTFTGDRFSGTWGYCDKTPSGPWTGERLGAAPATPVVSATPATPAAGSANLARGKPASQSSTSQWSRSNDAQGAVDGVINGGYGFHTDNQANPWWQVDLGGPARIDEVRVYNRQDCCGERARTLQVMLSDDGRQWRTAFRHGGAAFGGKDGNPLKVALAGAPARYVRLQLNETNWFHLDEVEVYGQMTGAATAAGGLSAADLTTRTWRFGRSNGSTIAERVRLTPAGKMEGYYHPNEDHWSLDDGVLAFRNPSNQVVTRFTSARNEGGRLVLSGPYQYDSSFQHVLTEVGVDAGAPPVPPGGRDYTGYTPDPVTTAPAGPAQAPTGAKLVLEDDAGPYQWNDATEVQSQRVHAGRAAFRSNGNDHFSHRLGLAGNYPGQYRYLDFWLWFDKPGADIQIQVQVDGNWGKRWGYEAGPSYDGYGWAMEGTTANQASGRWLHLRLDLIEQLHIAAGQAITGLAFSSDGADVWYDSVYLVPVESPLPAPAVRPSGKRVLEDDAGPYPWNDATVVQKEVVAYGQAAFRSDGNDHFTADLGVVGDYPEQFRTLSFWVFPIGAGADIQLQVQVNGEWGKRWGYEAGPKYDGYGWAMEGTSTGLRPGVWQELKIDLIRDLHINPGQKITGLAFSSDGADVYYDSVYLQANPSPAVKPSFQPAGRRVLEDDTGGYHWADATEVQGWLVFNGSRAFRSDGNDHFLADLGVAGNGAGQYRAVGFWAFFMGPAADLQLQVQVNGEWGKRWGYEAGPKYDGYGWAMEGTTANLPNGRWTWIRADLIDQLHLKPGDRITGLAFSSDGGDVAFDSVYLLPAGSAPGIGQGTEAGVPTVAVAPGGRDYTAQPGGRDYTGAASQGQLIFEIGNIGGTSNGPTKASRFTLETPHMITLIRDYHWNSARGAQPGSIALKGKDGGSWGPWPASGSPGQGGVPNAYWTATPNVVLPAGTYTVVDSDPASWSHNGESNGRGFVRVEGYPSGPGQITTTPTSGNTEVDQLLDAVKSLKGLFGK